MNAKLIITQMPGVISDLSTKFMTKMGIFCFSCLPVGVI